jgi:hypothetical protein
VRRRCDRRGLQLWKAPRSAARGTPAQYLLLRPEGFGLVAKVAFGPTDDLAAVEQELDAIDQERREKRAAVMAKRA